MSEYGDMMAGAGLVLGDDLGVIADKCALLATSELPRRLLTEEDLARLLRESSIRAAAYAVDCVRHRMAS